MKSRVKGRSSSPEGAHDPLCSRCVVVLTMTRSSERRRICSAEFSNARNFRRDPNIPLIMPLVNPSYLSIFPQKRALFDPSLKRVISANYSTTGYVNTPLRPFGQIKTVVLNHASYLRRRVPGVASLDILDNTSRERKKN